MNNDDKINRLFGILGYTSIDEYNDYVNRINSGNISDILITIQTAIRYSLGKGIYTLEESEVLSITLRKITQLLNNIEDNATT